MLEEPVNSKQYKSRKRRRHWSSSSESSTGSTNYRRKSPSRRRKSLLTPMIKPERCVLLSQLYEKITLEEVKHFLSPVGKIQSLQLEFCEDSHKFKKSAIVEFENTECVLLALGLNGQKLKGNFTIIQPIMRRQQL